MRKIAFYIINLFVIGSLWSCQGDEPTTTSIFDEEEEVAETEFDQWLLHNYTYPYNIAFKYVWKISNHPWIIHWHLLK